MNLLAGTDWISLLSFAGAFVALAGTLWSFFGVTRRARAEHRLIEELSRTYRNMHEHQVFLELHRAAVKGAPLPEHAYQDYLAHVQHAIAALEHQQRGLIQSALEQPSAVGRTAYVKKLIRETAAHVPAA